MSYRRSRSSVKSRSSRKRGRAYSTRARPVPAPSRRALADRAVELKHYDQVASINGPVALSRDATMTNMANINPALPKCLFAPSQGPGSQNREGRLATVQSIYLSGAVYCPQGINSENVQTVFLALVLDRSPNLQSIDGQTNLVYQNIAIGGDPAIPQLTYATTPLRNLEWSKRFKVLKTKTIVFNPSMANEPNANHYASMQRTFTMSYRPTGSDAQVEFQGSEGTVENITKNAYYVLGISNALSSAGLATIAYNSRVRFVG